MSDEELVAGGYAASGDPGDVLVGIESLRKHGANDVVVSCGAQGSIAAFGEARYRVIAPSMSVTDHRGAGDSMTAALAHGRRVGLADVDLLQLAAAAAALNVTRHGLASGNLAAIKRLVPLVNVEPISMR